MGASPLADIHAALGAHLGTLDGVDLVLDYGDAAAEQRSGRARGGLIDRSYRGKVHVSGPDRGELLQSLTTNDVIKQPLSSALPNAICTNHGKVRSLFNTLRFDEHYLLDMDPTVTEFTATFLERYTIIRDATTAGVERGHLGLYGPEAPGVLATVLGVAVDSLPVPDPAGDPVQHHGDANDLLVVANGELDLPGFELILPTANTADLWQRLVTAGGDMGVTPMGWTALEGLRIEAGRPRMGVDVGETELLLEAGLVDFARFDKGCFVGQETLSRIVYRGDVNRKLRGLTVDGPVPETGTPVASADAPDKVVGEVRSAVHSPSLDRVIALAYIKRSHGEAGSSVTVAGSAATVVDLPFVPPT